MAHCEHSCEHSHASVDFVSVDDVVPTLGTTSSASADSVASAVETLSILDTTKLENVDSTKVAITPVHDLPPGVVVVMSGTEEGGMPHGTMLLCEYARVGKDPVAFLRKCKQAGINTAISIGKKDPSFMAQVNEYFEIKAI